MGIQIRYKQQPGIDVETISVLGSFCGYDAEKGRMKQDGEEWVYEAKIPPGEHYYRFLVNGSVLLNDPVANCYVPREEGAEELWSYLKVDALGRRLYNNLPYTVHIGEYTLSTSITGEDAAEKHKFSSVLDKRVAARFGFQQVKGVHPVTVLWCDHTGQPREYAEQTLFPTGDGETANLWFWIDLEKLEQPEGTWTLKLFVDGSYVLEDVFQIGTAFLYTQEGKLKIS